MTLTMTALRTFVLAVTTVILVMVFPAISEGSPYVAFHVGYGAMEMKAIAGTSQKNKGTSYRVAAGYLFNVTDKVMIGPELGYLAYPKNTYTESGKKELEIKGYSLDLLMNVQYYLNTPWYVFGSAGLAYTRQQADIWDTELEKNQHFKKSKILPELGIGVGYSFNDNVSLSASYNRIFGKNYDPSSTSSIKVASVYSWMLGFTYHF